MEDFAQEWHRRASAALLRHTERQQQKSREQQERGASLDRLEEHLKGRSAQAGVNALLGMGYGTQQTRPLTREFTWTEPVPSRSLCIKLDRGSGRLLWAWVRNDKRSEWQEADARLVSPKDVDNLPYALADHDWELEEWPPVTLPCA